MTGPSQLGDGMQADKWRIQGNREEKAEFLLVDGHFGMGPGLRLRSGSVQKGGRQDKMDDFGKCAGMLQGYQ